MSAKITATGLTQSQVAAIFRLTAFRSGAITIVQQYRTDKSKITILKVGKQSWRITTRGKITEVTES